LDELKASMTDQRCIDTTIVATAINVNETMEMVRISQTGVGRRNKAAKPRMARAHANAVKVNPTM
jgi:hypothetical protein